MHKVLFVQNIEAIAGSENYFIQLMPELKRDYQVQVSFFNFYKKSAKKKAKEFTRILQEIDIEVFECQINNYASLKIPYQLYKTIKGDKFQIVHSHLVYADFYASLLKLLWGKFKLVSTLHGYQENIYYKYCLEPESVPKNLYYYLMKFSMKNFDLVYACSFGLADFFNKIGLGHKLGIQVVHHGFDYPEINLENAKALRQGNPMITIVGRLKKIKGHALIIKNFEMLLNEFSEAKLIVVGDGEESDELELLCKKKNLTENIVFQGFQSNPIDYMAASDLVLIPSYSEGLPLVIFEAFHSNTPVIAFDTIGCGEAIENGKTGILIEPFNGVQMLDEAIKLLKDKEMQLSLCENAKHQVKQKFSKVAMVKKTFEIYKKALSL